MNLTDISLPSGKKPNDICKAFPFGTLGGQPVDTVDGLNVALPEKLNKELQAIFTQPGIPKDLTLWQHYQVKGAIWVSDISQGSGSTTENTNQRGSLELANTVMETSFQGTPEQAGTSVNCFARHHYQGTASGIYNTQASATSAFKGLGHIFDAIISGQQCKNFYQQHHPQ